MLAMPGVGFLGMLIIGTNAGWIAEKITASDHGLLTDLLVGIAGSFVGGTLANLVNLEFYGWLGNFLLAAIGLWDGEPSPLVLHPSCSFHVLPQGEHRCSRLMLSGPAEP